MTITDFDPVPVTSSIYEALANQCHRVSQCPIPSFGQGRKRDPDVIFEDGLISPNVEVIAGHARGLPARGLPGKHVMSEAY